MIRTEGPISDQQPFDISLEMGVRVQGEEWKKTTLKTALLFPGVVFAIFLSLNFLVWGQKSSGAVPFGTLFALCFLWFGISVPLVFVGSYFGYKKPAPEDPVRTNKIPRQIPEQVGMPMPACFQGTMALGSCKHGVCVHLSCLAHTCNEVWTLPCARHKA